MFADTDLIVSTNSKLVSSTRRQVIDHRTISRHKRHGRHPHAHPRLFEFNRVTRDRFPAIQLGWFPL